MAKRYIRVNFQNSPSTATPLSAVNLNKLDKGIDDCDNAIEDLYNTKFDKLNIIRTDTVNDSTKVPSSEVTYALGQEVDTINNKLSVVLTVTTKDLAVVLDGQLRYGKMHKIVVCQLDALLSSSGAGTNYFSGLPLPAQANTVVLVTNTSGVAKRFYITASGQLQNIDAITSSYHAGTFSYISAS